MRSSSLEGTIEAPPSKSYTHRAIVATCLFKGVSRISRPLFSDDTEATIDACRALGSSIKITGSVLSVDGESFLSVSAKEIDCRESGSTIRFLTPVAALSRSKTVMSAQGSLRNRPMQPILEALRKLGVKCHSESGDGRPPLVIEGRGIPGGKTSLPGNVSSQFISGLLFASPLAAKNVEISVISPLESKPYVLMTLNVIKKHGIRCDVSRNLREYRIPAMQEYGRCNHLVPGDFSSASFPLVAAAVTRSEVTVRNLATQEEQPDQLILGILRDMGVALSVRDNSVTVSPNSMIGRKIDVRDCPDLVPILAVAGSFAKGRTLIKGAGRLRIKESDRLSSITSELSKMGAKIVEGRDSLTVEGPTGLKGAVADSHGDHRIVMACAVAALGAQGVTKINNAECIKKSYPSFIVDMKRLGADMRWVETP